MECPKCKKEIEIPTYAFNNAETYRNTVLSVSECCNSAFIIKPVTTFKITEYTGDKVQDDWGNKIKK